MVQKRTILLHLAGAKLEQRWNNPGIMPAVVSKTGQNKSKPFIIVEHGK
jgi:hypothetical protein